VSPLHYRARSFVFSGLLSKEWSPSLPPDTSTQGTVEDFDRSAASAATREAREEAGVVGTVTEVAGVYASKRGPAAVFVLDVKEEHATWPEIGVRQRHWMPVREAYRALKHDWQKRALKASGLLNPTTIGRKDHQA
jgi:hypothetical protein